MYLHHIPEKAAWGNSRLCRNTDVLDAQVVICSTDTCTFYGCCSPLVSAMTATLAARVRFPVGTKFSLQYLDTLGRRLLLRGCNCKVEQPYPEPAHSAAMNGIAWVNSLHSFIPLSKASAVHSWSLRECFKAQPKSMCVVATLIRLPMYMYVWRNFEVMSSTLYKATHWKTNKKNEVSYFTKTVQVFRGAVEYLRIDRALCKFDSLRSVQ